MTRGTICLRGTLRLWPRLAAISAIIAAALIPAAPRANNGGHSCNRNFIAGQFNPQPTEVTTSSSSNPMVRESSLYKAVFSYQGQMRLAKSE